MAGSKKKKGGGAFRKICPARFQMWYRLISQGKGMHVAIVIQESLMTFRGGASQVTGYETLFIKSVARDQLLLLYQPHCCTATCLSELLDAIYGMAVEFPRHAVVGHFNLPSLECGLRWLRSSWPP